jgi:hypothetical protein
LAAISTLALLAVGSGSARQATAAISGVVLDGTTGAPVAGATVALLIDGNARKESFNRRVLTDAKGRFVFDGLAANDRFTVGASKPGYLDGGFGSGAGASGGRVALSDGEWISDLRITLWRPATISGTVLDERGDPVVDVFVRVIEEIRLLGAEQLAAGLVVTTDDHGRYRIAGLTPGRYLVQVPSVQADVPADASRSLRGPSLALVVANRYPLPPPIVDGQPYSYPPLFFPGVRSLEEAAVVETGLAEERTGVDIHLTPMPAFQVSGVLEGPPGALTGQTIRLVPQGAENLGQGSEIATAAVSDAGHFRFVNVPAGTYTIEVTPSVGQLRQAWRPGAHRLGTMGGKGWDLGIGPPGLQIWKSFRGSMRPAHWAEQTVTIDGDLDGLVVAMRPAGTMRGRVLEEIVQGRPVFPVQASAMVALVPADGSPRLGMPESDTRFDQPGTDEFTIRGLLPGKYVLSAGESSQQRRWLVKSVAWQGRDYTDMPFDAAETQNFDGVQVVVTNGGATVAGVVRNDRGEPAPNANVVVFPDSPDLWTNVGLFPRRIRAVETAGNGQYTIERLPAGTYRVIAIEAPRASINLDGVFFQAHHALATRVSLEWEQQAALDLFARRQGQ